MNIPSFGRLRPAAVVGLVVLVVAAVCYVSLSRHYLSYTRISCVLAIGLAGSRMDRGGGVVRIPGR